MSYLIADFQKDVARKAAAFQLWYANTKPELTLAGTALGTETVTHDTTIENPISTILKPGFWTNTKFQNALNLIINKGKAGNLTGAQMATAVNAVAATLP